MDYLDPGELARIESEFARGLSAGAIVEIFPPKGARLSEATFRKYIQAGLLPRSRRVGRKGKHRGSHGLYPVESVRRINAIKKMMAAGLTLEEIRRSFVGVKNHIDQVERSLEETGLYPVESVRRINAIKKMMAAGLTLEEIRRSFVGVKNHIDQVERSLDETCL